MAERFPSGPSPRPETLPPLSLVNRHTFGSDRSGPGRKAAKRTLDGEDRSEIIRLEGKGDTRTRAFSAPPGGLFRAFPQG